MMIAGLLFIVIWFQSGSGSGSCPLIIIPGVNEPDLPVRMFRHKCKELIINVTLENYEVQVDWFLSDSTNVSEICRTRGLGPKDSITIQVDDEKYGSAYCGGDYEHGERCTRFRDLPIPFTVVAKRIMKVTFEVDEQFPDISHVPCGVMRLVPILPGSYSYTTAPSVWHEFARWTGLIGFLFAVAWFIGILFAVASLYFLWKKFPVRFFCRGDPPVSIGLQTDMIPLSPVVDEPKEIKPLKKQELVDSGCDIHQTHSNNQPVDDQEHLGDYTEEGSAGDNDE